MIKKPAYLRKGYTVAIVSPSWGGPYVFPHIYESGLCALRGFGLNIKEYPSAVKDPDCLYMNPEFRANDINNAFKDNEVKAIIASIGGDDSARLLPFLDPDAIRENPKMLMGFSDTTTLTAYFNSLGIVTFNGPAVMAGFSQWDSLSADFREHVETILFENPATYAYKPYDVYSEGYPDWSETSNTGRIMATKKNRGWNFLQGSLTHEGELFGGCIEVLEMMKSTRFWPDENFWKNKILFLETSEEKPSPDRVKYMLRNYGMQGVFDKISGLLFGRPMYYSDDEKKKLDDIILKVLNIEFKNTSIPVITNMDFGHTDPQWILPLGIKAEIDCNRKEFRLVEKIFRE